MIMYDNPNDQKEVNEKRTAMETAETELITVS